MIKSSGKKLLPKKLVSVNLLTMRLIICGLLFVFFSMLLEDALFAHAGAADLSPCQQEQDLGEFHHGPFPPDSSHHRDVTHFGHCSFLLISPLSDSLFVILPGVSATPYVFSLKVRFVEPFIRPPIS